LAKPVRPSCQAFKFQWCITPSQVSGFARWKAGIETRAQYMFVEFTPEQFVDPGDHADIAAVELARSD
jgi:hypothetical protein